MKTKPRKIHPNSLKNLIPMKPGQTLNPGGRPKGSVSLGNLLHKLLAKEIDGETHKTIAEALVSKMIGQALKGSFPQQNLIVNRIDGKVPLRIAGAEGDDLFAASQDTIEKIFSNPKAMDLAVKLSNCLNETEDKPIAKDGKGDGDGNTMRHTDVRRSS